MFDVSGDISGSPLPHVLSEDSGIWPPSRDNIDVLAKLLSVLFEEEAQVRTDPAEAKKKY